MKRKQNGGIQLKNTSDKKAQRRFLINAVVLGLADLFVAFSIPQWGVAQVFVVVLLSLLCGFQILLYIKLR